MPDSIAVRTQSYEVVPHSSAQHGDWLWAKERFSEEARMLSGFRHRAIVRVHELIEDNGTIYMVMEHVDGESYEARLRRIGWESSQSELWKLISPIMDGLSVVHAAGYLHRDIKPDNIIIANDGQPVLIDFGSARQAVSQTVTMTSIVTHGYSPIEQYQTKGRTGPWTDIYSLGAVMCRAVTGEKPPTSPDRVTDDDFAWLRFRNPGQYSAEFLAAIDWALQLNADDRPASLGQLRPYFEGDIETVPAAIRRAEEDNGASPRDVLTEISESEDNGTRRKTNLSLPLILSLAVLAGSVAYFLSSQVHKILGDERDAGIRAPSKADGRSADADSSRESNLPVPQDLRPPGFYHPGIMPSTPREAYEVYEAQQVRMLANQARAAGYTGLSSNPEDDPEAWKKALNEGIKVDTGGGQTVIFKMDGPAIIRPAKPR
jgi:serine/threonine protein kinase